MNNTDKLNIVVFVFIVLYLYRPLKQTEEVPLTPSLRHCSNKYKLAREGEKEKDEDLEKVNNQIFDRGVV